MNLTANAATARIHDLLMRTTDAGKHSAYQVLPTRLAALVGQHEAKIFSRFERERFAYLQAKLAFKGTSVLEIGPNAGFFTFEMLDAGASNVTAYEGGGIHCDFIEAAADVLDVADRVSVQREYFTFHRQDVEKHDIAMLLNVVHHTGDDYESTNSIEDAKVAMLEQINGMTRYADQLIFQMGFTWKGKNWNGFFDGGTKAEMINYVANGTQDHWAIEHIGIGQRSDGTVYYEDANDHNLPRDNSLGEFLNRPLFIMRAK